MSEGKTRCIIGAAAGLLWGATLATAHIDLNLRLYLAVLAAVGTATLTAVAWLITAKVQQNQVQRDADTRVMIHRAVGAIEGATMEHARRMEVATDRHGDHISKAAFRADHWFCNGMTAVKIARGDAILDVARTHEDGGPLRIINGRG